MSLRAGFRWLGWERPIRSSRLRMSELPGEGLKRRAASRRLERCSVSKPLHKSKV